MNVLKLVVPVVLVVAMVLQIESVATDFWSTASNEFTDNAGQRVRLKGSLGLWKMCETREVIVDSPSTSSKRICNQLLSEYETDRLKAARALIIVSIVGSLPSAALHLVLFVRRSPALVLTASSIILLQAIFQGAGVGMAAWWIDMFSILSPSYGWSFYLGMTVSLIYAAASVLGCASYAIESRQPVRSDAVEGARYSQMVPMLES